MAIIKCPADQKTNTFVAQGNNLATELAKTAALPHGVMAPVVAEEPCLTADLSSLIQVQEGLVSMKKRVWFKRGAVKNQQDGPHKGLWQGPSGHFVAPTSVFHALMKDVHGLDHCTRGEVLKRIQNAWWSPYLAIMVDKALHNCDVCAAYNNRKAFSAPTGHIPPPDGPFTQLMIDHVDMLEGVQDKRYMLVVADRYSDRQKP